MILFTPSASSSSIFLSTPYQFSLSFLISNCSPLPVFQSVHLPLHRHHISISLTLTHSLLLEVLNCSFLLFSSLLNLKCVHPLSPPPLPGVLSQFTLILYGTGSSSINPLSPDFPRPSNNSCKTFDAQQICIGETH